MNNNARHQSFGVGGTTITPPPAQFLVNADSNVLDWYRRCAIKDKSTAEKIVVKYIRSKYSVFDFELLLRMGWNYAIKVLLKKTKWEYGDVNGTMLLSTLACKCGNLEIVKHLDYLGKKFDKNAMDTASWNGYLEIVKWLDENRIEGCTVSAMESAAENGHLNVVKYLYENRVENCLERAMRCAERNNHREVAEWLRGKIK